MVELTEFAQSWVGLLAAVTALIGAVITMTATIKGLSKKWLMLLLCVILLLIGCTLVGLRFAFAPPTVVITSPSGSLQVTAEGDSVWFPVSGTSSHVVSDNSLRIYVLVHSGTEWHVQRAASILPDGQWMLDRAWIGHSTAPINLKSSLRIIAVVSRRQQSQDDKVQEPRELDPKAMSAPVTLTVDNISKP